MKLLYSIDTGQRVEYVYEKGVFGTVTDFFCDYGVHMVTVQWDDEEATMLLGREFSESNVSPVEGDTIEDLTLLAMTLDKARLQANAIESAASQRGVYGEISLALLDTLEMIFEGRVDDETLFANLAYNSLLDGNTVREALALVVVKDVK